MLLPRLLLLLQLKVQGQKTSKPPCLRHKHSVNSLVSFVLCVSSMFALPSSTASTRDGRPYIFGMVEDVDTDFLVDKVLL